LEWYREWGNEGGDVALLFCTKGLSEPVDLQEEDDSRKGKQPLGKEVNKKNVKEVK